MMARQADAFIGLRVPEPVKQRWAEQAKQERRSLSNWIITQLVERRPIHLDHRRRKAV